MLTGFSFRYQILVLAVGTINDANNANFSKLPNFRHTSAFSFANYLWKGWITKTSHRFPQLPPRRYINVSTGYHRVASDCKSLPEAICSSLLEFIEVLNPCDDSHQPWTPLLKSDPSYSFIICLESYVRINNANIVSLYKKIVFFAMWLQKKTNKKYFSYRLLWLELAPKIFLHYIEILQFILANIFHFCFCRLQMFSCLFANVNKRPPQTLLLLISPSWRRILISVKAWNVSFFYKICIRTHTYTYTTHPFRFLVLGKGSIVRIIVLIYSLVTPPHPSFNHLLHS